MAKTEEQYRQDILDVGKLIYQKGWVAANDGNISVRLDDRRILCTCTGVSKGMMTPADIIVCDLEGNKIDGARERTTEIAMHLTIYQMRPDVSAVVHAHPPVATGFAVAGRPLNLALLPEVIVSLGCVPLAEYGLPGTPALTDGMLPYIPEIRRDPAGQSWLGVLRRGCVQGVLQDGNRRALRARHAGGRAARRTRGFFPNTKWDNCLKHAGVTA